MAELNGDQRNRQQTTTAAAELNDDLILEIVKRLPLKYAVQCSVLNKNIRHRIFEPNFLPSYSTIFHYNIRPSSWIQSFWQGIGSTSTTVHPLGRSVPVNVPFSIIASCNGLLLIRFHNPCSGYLFNPTTSEIMPIRANFVQVRLGLCSFAAENSRFKFVAAEEYSRYPEGGYLKFSVNDEYSDISEYRVPLSRRFLLMLDPPVYAHGSFYWLGDGGRAMVAFDVEKNEARFIDGPVEGNDDKLEWLRHRRFTRWFGFADGSVQFVYVSSSSEIVICRHDHVNDEWRVMVRVPNERNPNKDNNKKSIGVFFDGRRVLFLVRECRTRVHLERYDVESDVWEEIGFVANLFSYSLNYFSYTSTFMKVSDTYFNEKNTDLWKNKGRRNVLLGLQQLLRPP